MSQQNKLVKTVTDSAVMVGLAAGVGYIAKKMLKENFLGDPSTSVMNYGKWTAILAGSMALKTYLEDQKILPKQLFCISRDTFFSLECIWRWDCPFRCWPSRWSITGSDWTTMWPLKRIYWGNS